MSGTHNQYPGVTNYLLTEIEVFTGKAQNENLPYRLSDGEVNNARPRFEIYPLKPYVRDFRYVIYLKLG